MKNNVLITALTLLASQACYAMYKRPISQNNSNSNAPKHTRFDNNLELLASVAIENEQNNPNQSLAHNDNREQNNNNNNNPIVCQDFQRGPHTDLNQSNIINNTNRVSNHNNPAQAPKRKPKYVRPFHLRILFGCDHPGCQFITEKEKRLILHQQSIKHGKNYSPSMISMVASERAD